MSFFHPDAEPQGTEHNPSPVPRISPSIGRIVHYIVDPSQGKPGGGNQASVIAGVIVAVWNDFTVNLKLLTDGPTDEWKTSVLYSDNATPGTWIWPPRI